MNNYSSLDESIVELSKSEEMTSGLKEINGYVILSLEQNRVVTAKKRHDSIK